MPRRLRSPYLHLMKDMAPGAAASAAGDRQRRLELARRAFVDFHAQCFWSYRADAAITEDKIPFVVRGLREHGGMAGYRVASEICR